MPVLDDILGRQGRALGLKVKSRLPDGRLSTVAEAFAKSFDPKTINIVSCSDKKFHIQGTTCSFGLENTEPPLFADDIPFSAVLLDMHNKIF